MRKNKNIIRVLILLCLAGAVCFTGCKFGKGKKTEITAEQIKVNVTAGKVSRRTLFQERKILATLEAYRETDLGPLTPGRVKSLHFKIGDYVSKGQIVAEMDDVQFTASNAQFQSLKAQYERSLSLYKDNALPKAQFESVEAQYIAMKRQMESLEENTIIKAPFSGVVTARTVEEGELYSPSMMASPGQSNGLIRITQLDPLKIDLEVDDQTIMNVKKGMTIRLTVDQINDSTEIYGKVEWVNPQANAMSRTFSVRVIVQNTKQLLKPGYFAEVHIILGEKKNALTVPAGAVVDNHVFVLKDNIAYMKKVTTGWITDDYIEILSGVNEEEAVVLSGNKALPDSAKVEVVNPPANETEKTTEAN